MPNFGQKFQIFPHRGKYTLTHAVSAYTKFAFSINFFRFAQEIDWKSKFLSRAPLGVTLEYVCAKLKYLSFKTGPIKKYWELRPRELFEKNMFRKNFFRGFGDSPKTKKGKKFLISEIVRNHSHGHFKPLLGQFGHKMEEWRCVEVKNRENRNRLEPPSP